MNERIEQRVRWHDFATVESLQAEAARRIACAANRAIAEHAVFRIVLPGGSTPRAAYRMLRKAKTEWPAWRVYFGDERCLPAEDDERNSRMARDELLNHVPVPDRNIHVIPAERGAEEAAAAYSGILRDIGPFDLVLLGLGEDGHTASLFPQHGWGRDPESADTLAVFDAPKPPPQRVSLSAARLSRARGVLFLVSGEAKRGAVAQWRGGADIPARAIVPSAGVDVLLEAAALPKHVG